MFCSIKMSNSLVKYSVLLAAVISMGAVQVGAAEVNPPQTIDVELIGANQTEKEDKAVLASLQKLLAGLASSNIEQIGACLSDDVTTLDSKTNQYLHGKESVIAHIKKNVVGTGANHPVKKLVIHNPFVHVKGDTAMVSFRATKSLNDPGATTLESWCSEVYERKNGEWLVLNLKTEWKPIKK